MTSRIAAVHDADDPRLAPYRLVADPPSLAAAGLFAVEGRLVVPRLLASPFTAHSVLAVESALESLQPSLVGHPDLDVFIAPPDIVNTVSGFHFHRGCVALGHRGEPRSLESVVARGNTGGTLEAGGSLRSEATSSGSDATSLGPLAHGLWPILILESVSNPDNIGGLFRSAHAFGARGVVLGPGCGDPLYRKAIRTSMGATLDVPWTIVAATAGAVAARAVSTATTVAPGSTWLDALASIRAAGYHLIALVTNDDAPSIREAAASIRDAATIRDATSTRTVGGRPVALMLGSEGFGLSAEAREAADTLARIPMPNTAADSLNVAVAGGIALYEVG